MFLSSKTSLTALTAAGLATWWVWTSDSSDISGPIMKACLRTSNGPTFTDQHPKPTGSPGSGELLVKIKAAAINPVDYKVPKLILGPIMGLDFAGVIEAVPDAETKFKIGDEVFGSTKGSMTEYALCQVASTALKPSELSFEEAAALPTAYITALQGLRDKGSIKQGDKVLVIGASGGCGLAGVHLAIALGAEEVVGVCSGRNKELVLSQGASKVVDYTSENLSEVFPSEYFDLVYDTATGSGGGEDYFALSESLLKKGKTAKNVILNGGAWTWMSYFLGLQKSNRRLVLTDMNTKDLDILSELYNSKKIPPPIISKTFQLSPEGVKEGFELLKSRRTVGKIVFTVAED